MGLEVWGDGTFILRPTCRTHIGAVRDWHVAAAEPYAAISQLGSTREGEIIMSEDCKGGAQQSGAQGLPMLTALYHDVKR